MEYPKDRISFSWEWWPSIYLNFKLLSIILLSHASVLINLKTVSPLAHRYYHQRSYELSCINNEK